MPSTSTTIPDDALFLCVDCGGTKTAVAVANREGQVIARSTGGPSNFAYLGASNFLRTVQTSIEDVLKVVYAAKGDDEENGEKWRLPPNASQRPPFFAAWFGVSGVDSPANVALLTPQLAALLALPSELGSDRLIICNDTHLLAAPLQLYRDVNSAVCVIGGTGSISASFRRGKSRNDANGNTTGQMLEPLARVGGWGWILGDEGGGFDAGRTAVRMILREYELAVLHGEGEDGVDGSSGPGKVLAKSSWLVREVLRVFGVQEPPELLVTVHDPDPATDPEPESNSTTTNEDPLGAANHFLHLNALHTRTLPREKRLSQLAPLVFTAAFTHNDTLALRVLESCAMSLAEQTIFLLRPTPDLDAVNATNSRAVDARDSLLTFGGSLVGVEQYRDMVVRALEKQGHVFRAVEYVGDAAGTGAKGLAGYFVGGATRV